MRFASPSQAVVAAESGVPTVGRDEILENGFLANRALLSLLLSQYRLRTRIAANPALAAKLLTSWVLADD